MPILQPDFSGYATKHDVLCSDGRIIRHSAFVQDNGRTVPLMWAHMHADPANVIGYANLEHRDGGVYAYAYLNDSERARQARELVQHGDLNSFSIYANRLKQQGSNVVGGRIVEVSLVLSGANPGATIDNILRHADDAEAFEIVSDQAIMTFGDKLVHSDDAEVPLNEDTDNDSETGLEHSDDNPTLAEIYHSMSETQQALVQHLVEAALQTKDEDEMSHNLFEGNQSQSFNAASITDLRNTIFVEALSHAQDNRATSFMDVVQDVFLEHSGRGETYGISNIGFLFPDPKTVTDTPQFISREMTWVREVLSGTHKVPFNRIKSLFADITAEEARAKGYITGAKKSEEVFKLLKRVTTPTTIYKKQKLDRDDVVDITDFDVVRWMAGEMGIMLREELARAILVGDGRKFSSPDKVNEENIRPIYYDHELFATRLMLPQNAATATWVDKILMAKTKYKGSGAPVFYTTAENHIKMLTLRDTQGRRLYNSDTELAAAIGVSKIVDVEVMEGIKRSTEDSTYDLIGIIVNLADYTVGATKGGETTDFEAFDIDFNQHKFLKELRCCGALTRPKSAIIVEIKTGGKTQDLIDSDRKEPAIEGR